MALANVAQVAMDTTDVMMGKLGSDTLAAGAPDTNPYSMVR